MKKIDILVIIINLVITFLLAALVRENSDATWSEAYLISAPALVMNLIVYILVRDRIAKV